MGVGVGVGVDVAAVRLTTVKPSLISSPQQYNATNQQTTPYLPHGFLFKLLPLQYLDLEAATRFSLASKACRDAVRSVSVFRRRHLARTGTNFRTTPA